VRPTIFDFNGVLVDDENVHFASFAEALAPLGLTLTRDEYDERYLGFDDAGAFDAILKDAGRAPTAGDVARLVDAKKPIYMRRIATDLVVFEGAAELVRARASGGVVGIVSGALRHEIEHCLGVMGVRDRVAFIVSAEDALRCKPDPEGYHIGIEALRAAGAPAERAVVVEDSIAGVESAKAAGLRCVSVGHSYPLDRLLRAGADAAVAHLRELTEAIIDGEQG
jgi:beta-phosphoglucomutase